MFLLTVEVRNHLSVRLKPRSERANADRKTRANSHTRVYTATKTQHARKHTHVRVSDVIFVAAGPRLASHFLAHNIIWHHE